MNHPILRTEQLKTHYVLDVHGTQKVVKAVDGVDLNIREDEVYGIAGESGCGKTTLLKALAAAIDPPLRLVGGKVYYRVTGVELDDASLNLLSVPNSDADRYMASEEIDVALLGVEAKRRLRWQYVSYVPQGSMSVLNPVTKIKETARDFIESHVTGKTRGEMFESARQHIAELGLPPNILDAYPHQLSGGMRQRVTIALATILKPRIIIGDEPTTALDVVVQRGVVQLLKDIQRKLQNTIVLVTHDMGVHANIADRIGIMYAGKIVDLWRAAPSLHPILDQLFAKVRGQRYPRECAGLPTVSCKSTQWLSFSSPVPARHGRMCYPDAGAHADECQPQGCLLAGRRRGQWKKFLKSIS